jgi:voltage-gated potassium channel
VSDTSPTPDATSAWSTGVRLPLRGGGPMRAVGRRVLFAFAVLLAVVAIVWLDRDGYNDTSDGRVDLLDAFYYATVTLSTTGYGDITPVADGARLINVLAITPLRVLFLIVLVGTTLEVLTQRGRELIRISRWRKHLQDHTIIVGFGTKGRSAAATLLSSGNPPTSIVVIDPSPRQVAEANDFGYAGVLGDATRGDVLVRAGVREAEQVIVATDRDDSATLVTLSVRRLNPEAKVVVAVREQENAPLMVQSGANSVITTSESAGRLLGLAAVSPALGSVLEDLLISGEGYEMAERPVLPREEGKSPRQTDDLVVSVVRDGQVMRWYEPAAGHLLRGDRLIVIRPAVETPWARRPGAEPVE